MKKNNKDVEKTEKRKGENNLELGLYLIKDVFEKEINESKTKFITGAIRSGNKIIYGGSIVVIGDVNAGAEIIAEENIVVLGDLRGVAHAGANGNKKAIIAAQSIASPQLRIANIVWENEDGLAEYNNVRKYVYVENEEIKIVNK